MSTSDILMVVSIVMNCIVIIAAPIISVWVAQKLQDRARKRQDKMEIFRTLMTNRIYDWTPQAVYALNSIDIVFSDDDKVRQQWKKYYDTLCVENATETELKKMKIEKDKLLETMANSLGYKDKISWETIQNPYLPKGMVISMNQQQQFQAGQLQVLQMLTSIPNNANKNEENQGKQTENRNRKTDGRRNK